MGLSKHSHLIFAFGSNLDEDQMARRCPSAILISAATLPGFRLAFAGWSASWGGAVATVRRSRLSTPGAVYMVSREDRQRLDRCEGHPWKYVRRRSAVVTACGSRLAIQYYRLDDHPFGAPSPQYVDAIAKGYRSHGLELADLDAALDFTENRTVPGDAERMFSHDPAVALEWANQVA